MKRTLAALAAAPLALALLGQPAQAREAEQSAGSTPHQLLDVSDLETGEPPAIAYAEQTSSKAWTIHGTSGETEIRGRLRDFAPMGSGHVVQTGRTGPVTTRWIGADGAPGAGSWRGAMGLGVSTGAETVAVSGQDGAVVVIDSEGDRVLKMRSVPGSGSDTAAVGVTDGDCQEGESSNGCAVFVNSLSQPISLVTSSHGIVETMPWREISTVHGGWVGGVVKVTDTRSCSTMAQRIGHPRWRTCRNSFSDISPASTHVLGLPAYGDGLGPTRLDLLDLRSGDRVRSWVPDRSGTTATYFDEAWEDPEHVLVVTLQDHEWAIVRLGLDGSMEYAVPPRGGTGQPSAPLLLAVG